jgi:pimeloyl-ACP methyl ester carboxylesterase
MHEEFVQLDGEIVFVRHSETRPGRPTLFFVHALGDSGLAFSEAFHHLQSINYNLVAPDLVGYGKSSAALNGDYSIASQILRLKRVASLLGVAQLILVGHSLGGLIATEWAASQSPTQLQALVNIEGNLTPADASFTRRAVEAFRSFAEDSTVWSAWFRSTFVPSLTASEHGRPSSSLLRYYSSILPCRPEAFLANSLEILQLTDVAPGETLSPIAARYLAVGLPKLYCWGTDSLDPATQDLLERCGLPNRSFPGAGHWPMIDAPEVFYAGLRDWLSSNRLGSSKGDPS